jgi:endoribonuclease Dicer
LKRRQSSVASSNDPNADVKSEYVEKWISSIDGGAPDPGDEGQYNPGYDDEEDEAAPATKPRKISERKRRQNAIADSHIQIALQKSLKKGSRRLKPEEEAQQSARWLVNQSESHEIISTPRAYQTELFERAKEGNIIAVLDTGEFYINIHSHNLTVIGSGKTLIAVLLLRHIFGQELEDRAMGKPNRLSFFLVRLT